jgi:NADPH:quinone reductase-like Zn-dependent oxidoreductase
MSNMKAVRIHSYGSSDVLSYEDAPRPVPGEGDVLIRIQATSINPFDVAVRSGYMTGFFNHTFPLILGTDVSGVVEALGPNTNSFSPGQAVYTRAGIIKDGSYAEYVVVPAADVTAKPASLDHVHAAAIPHAALTAWQALFGLANLSKGQTVLIHGAAGGVGHLAVQLAKWKGAHVIGTASVNYDLLDSLGVDQKINYATMKFEEVVEPVDVVLDTIGGDTQQRSWGILKAGGMLVSTIEAPAAETAQAHGVNAAMVFSAPPVAETLAELAQLVETGQLKPVVSTVLPLAEARKGHQMVEGKHTRGKIILQTA